MSVTRVSFGRQRSKLRLLAYAGAAVPLLALAVLAGAWAWLATGLPRTVGTAQLPGLSAPASITRDKDGIPWIRAASALDAWTALGFVHAQDRLTQMEMTRRFVSGRLSEVVGQRALPSDKLVRTLGLRQSAERSLAAASPDFRAVLDAYAAGVNAGVAARPGPLPIEFVLARIDWEPWTALDGLLWGKAMALQLSGNWRSELMRARLLAVLPPERIDELYPPDDPTGPSTIRASDAAPGATPKAARAELGAGARTALAGLAVPRLPDLPPPFDVAGASNVWAVAGQRTDTGGAILATDPHLGLQTPAMWYLARIEAPGLALAGATVPGVPAMVVGHNGQVAWAFTTTHADTQDFVVERVDPADPRRYLTPSGSLPFEQRTETILSSDGPPVQLAVRATRHGPVITGLDETADDATRTVGQATGIGAAALLALAWPLLLETDRSMEGLVRLNLARDRQEFVTVAPLVNAPIQNVFYADRAGNIGFMAPGLIPVRESHDGRYPVTGWDRPRIWSGYVPAAQMPSAANPPDGVLINANNRIVPPDYPFPISLDWPEPYRARRIGELLAGPAPVSLDRSAAAQLDSVSLLARELLPLMLAAAGEAPPSAEDVREATALKLLAAWDGEMLAARPEPLLFLAWAKELSWGLYADELGPLARDFHYWHPRFLRAVLSGQAHWCDDVRTPDRRESCAEVARAALVRAVAGLADRLGGEPASWRWGDVHEARFRHPLLGSLPLVGGWFGRSVASDGDDFTVNRASPAFRSGAAAWRHVSGASLRVVFDMADPDSSRFMIATGQSGDVLSPHYVDMVERWRDGVPVRLPRQAPEDGRVLALVP
ncbi:MAG: penicillin acylase family protein [Alphaproteobacteria bacterium]|nr:penicillin acylase family protein [Alphaproteobacteria bacterium]